MTGIDTKALRMAAQRERLRGHVDAITDKYLKGDEWLGAQVAGSAEDVNDELSKNDGTLLYELMQNADDNPYSDRDNAVVFELNGQTFGFAHNGDQFSEDDLKGISAIRLSGEKRKNPNATGFKGIGFKSIFRYSSVVRVKSGRDCAFKFDEQRVFDFVADRAPFAWLNGVWRQIPHWVDPDKFGHAVSESLGTHFSSCAIQFVAELRTEESAGEIRELLEKLLAHPEQIYFLRKVRSVTCIINGVSKTVESSRKSNAVVSSGPNRPQKRYARYVREGLKIPDEVRDFLLSPDCPKNVPARLKEKVSAEIELVLHGLEEIPIHNLSATLPMLGSKYGLPYILQAHFVPTTDRSSFEPNVYNEWLLLEGGKLAADAIVHLWQRERTDINYDSIAKIIALTLDADEKVKHIKDGLIEALLESGLPNSRGELRSIDHLIADPDGLRKLGSGAELQYWTEIKELQLMQKSLSALPALLRRAEARVLKPADFVGLFQNEAYRRAVTAEPKLGIDFLKQVYALSEGENRATVFSPVAPVVKGHYRLPTRERQQVDIGSLWFGVPDEHRTIHQAIYVKVLYAHEELEGAYANDREFRKAIGEFGGHRWRPLDFIKRCAEKLPDLQRLVRADEAFAKTLWRTLFQLRGVEATTGGPAIGEEPFGKLYIWATKVGFGQNEAVAFASLRLGGTGDAIGPESKALLKLLKPELVEFELSVDDLRGNVGTAEQWNAFLQKLHPRGGNPLIDHVLGLINATNSNIPNKLHYANFNCQYTEAEAKQVLLVTRAAIELRRKHGSQKIPDSLLAKLRVPLTGYRKLIAVEYIQVFMSSGELVIRHPGYPTLSALALDENMLVDFDSNFIGQHLGTDFLIMVRPAYKAPITERQLGELAIAAFKTQRGSKLSDAAAAAFTEELFRLRVAHPELQSEIPYGLLKFQAVDEGVFPGYRFVPGSFTTPASGKWPAMEAAKATHACKLHSRYAALGQGQLASLWQDFLSLCFVSNDVKVISTGPLQRSVGTSVEQAHCTEANVLKAFTTKPAKDDVFVPDLGYAVHNAAALDEAWRFLGEQTQETYELILRNSIFDEPDQPVISTQGGYVKATEAYAPGVELRSTETKSRGCTLDERLTADLHLRTILSFEDAREELRHAATVGDDASRVYFFEVLREDIFDNSLAKLAAAPYSETLAGLSVPMLDGSFRPVEETFYADPDGNTEELGGYLSTSEYRDRIVARAGLAQSHQRSYTRLLANARAHAIDNESWRISHQVRGQHEQESADLQKAFEACKAVLVDLDTDETRRMVEGLSEMELISCSTLRMENTLLEGINLPVQIHVDQDNFIVYAISYHDFLDKLFDEKSKAFGSYKGASLAGPIRQLVNGQPKPEPPRPPMVPAAPLKPVVVPMPVIAPVTPPLPAPTPLAPTTATKPDGNPGGGVTNPGIDDPKNAKDSKSNYSEEDQAAIRDGLIALGLSLSEDQVFLQHQAALGLAASFLLDLKGDVAKIPSGTDPKKVFEISAIHNGITTNYLVSGARRGLLYVSEFYMTQLLVRPELHYLVVTRAGVQDFASLAELLQEYGNDQHTIIRSDSVLDPVALRDSLSALSEANPRALFIVPDSKAAHDFKDLFTVKRKDKADGGGGTYADLDDDY